MTWIVVLFGLLIGSFLNVCIYRIPEKTFWKNKRSVCRHCHTPIPFYYNIPVVSYMVLRGKARCCGQKISWQYPGVEILTAILLTTVYWCMPFVVTYDQHMAIDNANLLRFIHASILTCLLLVCSFIDLRLMIIPDVISIPMILATPLVVFMHPDLDWRSAAIGVFAGGAVFYMIAWLYWAVRREIGLGFGDVKLLAAIGGWLGYQAILPTIFMGSIIGAITGIVLMVITRQVSLKTALPFGPFLALAAYLHLCFGHIIQEWLFVATKTG